MKSVLKLTHSQFQNIFACIAFIWQNTDSRRMIFKWKHLCVLLRKLYKFSCLENHMSGFDSSIQRCNFTDPAICDIIYWNGHSRKVNYSFYFGLRKLPTEEAFSMLRDNTIIAMLLMYEVAPVAPFTWGTEFIFCFFFFKKKKISLQQYCSLHFHLKQDEFAIWMHLHILKHYRKEILRF